MGCRGEKGKKLLVVIGRTLLLQKISGTYPCVLFAGAQLNRSSQ